METIVGLDLGQAADYTALSVVEVNPTVYTNRVQYRNPVNYCLDYYDQKIERPPLSFNVRHLERFAIGTSYPDVVKRVKEIFAKLPAGTTLVVDGTGVGRPVVDMLAQQGLRPVCITITGGDTVTQDGAWFRVPKRDVVGVLAVAFQNKKLKIARTLSYAETLVSELLNFKVKINLKTAHDSYEAWREGVHDDLVLSVGLAAWTAHFYYQNRKYVYTFEDDYRI